jgi:formate hydrogenlyase subunit 3/multisubunit Na+/H+ antiporter MnhD subunit
VAVAGCVAGSLLELAAALPVLLGTPSSFHSLSWRVPGGGLVLGLDVLSAFFLVLVAVVAVPTSIYGASYLLAHGRGKNLGAAFCLFNLLVAAMAAVVAARSALFFLVAWETMTLSSYFLVVFDHEAAEVRSAGMRYLVASQLGGACILALFAILGSNSGSMEFGSFAEAGARCGPLLGALVFALALAGFGTKAGLVPVHVWLPLAHPAAPSPVSALMSGVMIKTGLYGLLRVTTFLGRPSSVHGITLMLIGGITALTGIVWSLGQKDLKRALAYSSIENVGIAATGLGLALTASALGEGAIARLAAAGALLHVLNHAIMKSLLFLSAGASIHAAGTRNVEELGGLLGRMRWTGAAFLAGAAAISSLPPLCGFVGEWLILSAAFSAAGRFPVGESAIVVLASLALVTSAGLAAASFARLFGTVFLGRARSEGARNAREVPLAMRLPQAALAAGCLAIGLLPAQAFELVRSAAVQLTGGAGGEDPAAAASLVALSSIGRVAALLAGIVLAVWLVRSLLRGARREAEVDTWGCGYGRPGLRLQYSASGFGQPLVQVFRSILAPRAEEHRPEAFFSASIGRSSETPDRVEEAFYVPLFRGVARRLAVVRRAQDGRLNKYILQIVAVLVVCLLWAVVSRWVLAA